MRGLCDSLAWEGAGRVGGLCRARLSEPGLNGLKDFHDARPVRFPPMGGCREGLGGFA
jgi:hypothetical protein